MKWKVSKYTKRAWPKVVPPPHVPRVVPPPTPTPQVVPPPVQPPCTEEVSDAAQQDTNKPKPTQKVEMLFGKPLLKKAMPPLPRSNVLRPTPPAGPPPPHVLKGAYLSGDDSEMSYSDSDAADEAESDSAMDKTEEGSEVSSVEGVEKKINESLDLVLAMSPEENETFLNRAEELLSDVRAARSSRSNKRKRDP